MTVGTITALVVAIPIMLVPVGFVWYLVGGGIYAAARERRARTALEAELAKTAKAGR